MAQTDLRGLLDKQACVELVYRLARAIDRCDEALLRSLFHPDATDDHGGYRGSASGFVDWVLPLLATMTRTQHCICNVLIEVTGDTARGESYFNAHHALPQPQGPDVYMVAAGRYLDSFERRDGEWRFSHRQACYDWNAQAPATDSWDRGASPGWMFGQRGTADASYANFAGDLRPRAGSA
ncbi:nuclear transport factor 2 family protein [Phenylobacterium sp.]|uniref:nuclear transport factor 2 family protein n=1 Tax=Phenylobacterium sp. TaxID=1871053 RepID=UPI0025D27495|nr:nuclear transport factor 2 family protein [Phenylobacterium sp.]